MFFLIPKLLVWVNWRSLSLCPNDVYELPHFTSGSFCAFSTIAYLCVCVCACACPPRRYGKTSRWRHKARYGGKPAFLKFYSSYFLFGQTPRPSGIRPSGRQDQALSGRGASPSESGRRLMCRPVCWNICFAGCFVGFAGRAVGRALAHSMAHLANLPYKNTRTVIPAQAGI